MTFLTKESILQSNDRKTEVVDVPEWGGKVIVSSLTSVERDAFENELVTMMQEDGTDIPRTIRANLVVRSLVDEEGKRIFQDKDAAILGAKNASVVDRLFKVAQKLSGMSEKDVQEMVKN